MDLREEEESRIVPKEANRRKVKKNNKKINNYGRLNRQPSCTQTFQNVTMTWGGHLNTGGQNLQGRRQTRSPKLKEQ